LSRIIVQIFHSFSQNQIYWNTKCINTWHCTNICIICSYNDVHRKWSEAKKIFKKCKTYPNHGQFLLDHKPTYKGLSHAKQCLQATR